MCSTSYHLDQGRGRRRRPRPGGDREEATAQISLLESILLPATHIARVETVTVRVKENTMAGVLKSEDTAQVVLIDPEKGDCD